MTTSCTQAIAGVGEVLLMADGVQGKKAQIIPWATYDTGKLRLNIRYNFDSPDSPAILFGRSFQKGNTSVIPEVGMILGNTYTAITSEVTVIGEGEKLSWFSMNQLAFGSDKYHLDYAYNWTEVFWKVDRHVKLGLSGQAYYEWTTVGADPELDIGPIVEIPVFQRSYVNVSVMINPVTKIKSFFATVGTSF